MVSAGILGGGLGLTGLIGTLAKRGSKSSSSISSPTISSVSPKNITNQSSVSSVGTSRQKTPSLPSQKSKSIEFEPIAIKRATGARKREIKAQIVAERKAAYLGGKTVADIKRNKKKYRNTQNVLKRRIALGGEGNALRNLQSERQDIRRAIANREYSNRKELRKLGRNYARTSEKITNAKTDVSRRRNSDWHRRLDAAEAYLIANGRGAKKTY
jgi:hypothetical protein